MGNLISRLALFEWIDSVVWFGVVRCSMGLVSACVPSNLFYLPYYYLFFIFLLPFFVCLPTLNLARLCGVDLSICQLYFVPHYAYTHAHGKAS